MKLKFIKYPLLVFFLLTSKLCFAQDNVDDFSSFESIFSKPKENKIYDPLEPINRKIFLFNDFFDRNIFEPSIRKYDEYTPNFIIKSVRNITRNTMAPLSIVNSFSQGKFNNGLANLSSFIINSTIGIFGIFDIAAEKNIVYSQEDFGQTLAFYNLSPGPYLILPFLGPSNLRDFSGRIVDATIDPLSFNRLEIGGSEDGFIHDKYRVITNSLSVIESRRQLLVIISDARKNSFDFYAKIRSFYYQNRKSQIKK